MSNATIEYKSTGKLEKMSGPELIKLHNELDPANPVKRFSSKDAGVKRVLALLAKAGNAGAPAPSASMPKREAAPRPEVTETPAAAPATGNRRKVFNLAPRVRIKPHREGTKREAAIKLLSRANGGTFEEVQEACHWDYRTTYEGIKLLHVHCGYGLREDDKGRIRLTTRENDAERGGKQ